jgi:hypothetical protein
MVHGLQIRVSGHPTHCWRRFVIGARRTTFLVQHGLQIRASNVGITTDANVAGSKMLMPIWLRCWRRFVIGARRTTFLVQHGLQIRASDVGITTGANVAGSKMPR